MEGVMMTEMKMVMEMRETMMMMMRRRRRIIQREESSLRGDRAFAAVTLTDVQEMDPDEVLAMEQEYANSL
eukprot:765961-Hanusia_phi.AAC.1